MICPQLQYVGPTKYDLLQATAKFLPQWTKWYEQANPHAKQRVVVTEAKVWEKRKTHKYKQKFRPMTISDKRAIKGFQKLGWLEYEPVIAREIELMRQGKSV